MSVTQPLPTGLRMLEPYDTPALHLRNRMVMAPLTRSRAGRDGVPTPMMAAYYAQRASAGLIIAEATHIAPEGQGYVYMPGIFSEAQVLGWQAVTEAVHAQGGTLFLQLYHAGRVGHSSFADGKPPVAPSPLVHPGERRVYDGKVPYETPHELSLADIGTLIATFVQAARFAMEAGFDGVEVHGANGYLPNQFLAATTNRRTDAYGGTPERRGRFLLELIEALSKAIGPERVGLRLSPLNTNHGAIEPEPLETYGTLIRALAGAGLAYLHLMEYHRPEGLEGVDWPAGASVVETFRPLYPGTLIASSGLTKDHAEHLIANGLADLVAFGTAFIANPDLPDRFRIGAALNPADKATFYTGGEKGYLDYPTLAAASA